MFDCLSTFGIDQGRAQALLGTEASAELDSLSDVYCIVTNYTLWYFFKSTNASIYESESQLLTATQCNESAYRNQLQNITNLICSIFYSK